MLRKHTDGKSFAFTPKNDWTTDLIMIGDDSYKVNDVFELEIGLS